MKDSKFWQWFATGLNILGAFVVASRFFLPGYTLFLIAACMWLFIMCKRRDWPQVTLNGFFASANILGLYNAII
jgi:hypothetical protein